MQKISSYLYPNRVELLADLAGFTTEYTNVYQRTVKIYNGIDNTIEFDIKNADQKRIDLATLTQIELNVMDAQGNALENSPYTVTPTALKGIATVTIPQEDLTELSSQYLKYSVTALSSLGKDVLLYADTRFGAVGTIELVGDAMPTFRDDAVYKTFHGEIDLAGFPRHYSSAIPVTFYEAEPTTTISFDIKVTGFIGTIWLEATEASTVSVESFRAAGKPYGSWNREVTDGEFTGVIPFGQNISINNYKYFRVCYQAVGMSGYGADFTVTKKDNMYTAKVRTPGTNYTKGSKILIVGSQLGGVDGVNDLVLTLNGTLELTAIKQPANYVGTQVNDPIVAVGVATNGEDTFIVSGENFSGKVDSVTVS
jgi:hypothetical protein